MSVFSFLDRTACFVVLLEALLDAHMFDLAQQLLEDELDRARELGGAEAAASTLTQCAEVALKVACELMDSASSCRDAVWYHARQCLALVPVAADLAAQGELSVEGLSAEPVGSERGGAEGGGAGGVAQWQERVRREQELMEAVEMLDALGLDPLPVAIRQAQRKDPLSIIGRAVQDAPARWRTRTEAVRLGRLLGLTARADELRITELMARAMLVAAASGDAGGGGGTVRAEAMQLLTVLMDAGWAGVCDVCERLAGEEEARALELSVRQRLALAAHALAHCPVARAPCCLVLCQRLRRAVLLEVGAARCYVSIDPSIYMYDVCI